MAPYTRRAPTHHQLNSNPYPTISGSNLPVDSSSDCPCKNSGFSSMNDDGNYICHDGSVAIKTSTEKDPLAIANHTLCIDGAGRKWSDPDFGLSTPNNPNISSEKYEHKNAISGYSAASEDNLTYVSVQGVAGGKSEDVALKEIMDKNTIEDAAK